MLSLLALAGAAIQCDLQVEERAGVVHHSLEHAKLVLGDTLELLAHRIADEYAWEEHVADRLAEEYARYWVLLTDAPVGKELVASEMIDFVWHEHLLMTKRYWSETHAFFGHYLHHNRAVTPEEIAGIPGAYDRTLNAYRLKFGEPSLEWGEAAQSMCNGDSDGGGGVEDQRKREQAAHRRRRSEARASAERQTVMDAYAKWENEGDCPVEWCEPNSQHSKIDGQSNCEIGTDAAYMLWEEGKIPFWIDVRDEVEWTGTGTNCPKDCLGHIDGTYLYPDLFTNNTDHLHPTLCREAPMIVSCWTGSRSKPAAMKLFENGFKCVFNYWQGIAAWADWNYTLVKDAWDDSTALPDVCTNPPYEGAGAFGKKEQTAAELEAELMAAYGDMVELDDDDTDPTTSWAAAVLVSWVVL